MQTVERREEGSAMKTEAELRDLLAKARHDVDEEMTRDDPRSVALAQARTVVATLLKVLGE
jgi:hypothetical protein